MIAEIISEYLFVTPFAFFAHRSWNNTIMTTDISVIMTILQKYQIMVKTSEPRQVYKFSGF